MPQSLTLKQLTYFVALAEARNYRRAAARVGVSQPSLSQQIVGLEDALGAQLIERGKRGTVLTPCGREVYEQALKIIGETDVLRQLVTDTRKGMNGTIRLGSSPTLGPYFLPFALRQLQEAFPSLNMVVREASPQILQDELLEGQHDLILVQLPLRSVDLEIQRLFREPLKLVVSQKNPLSSLRAAEDADLSDQDVMTLSNSYVLHDQIVDLCREIGAHLRQDYEGTSLDALRQMTALDMGVTLLPALYVQSEVAAEAADLAILPFRRDRFTRSVGLAWRRQSTHHEIITRVADVFRDVSRERFQGLVTVEA